MMLRAFLFFNNGLSVFIKENDSTFIKSNAKLHGLLGYRFQRSGPDEQNAFFFLPVRFPRLRGHLISPPGRRHGSLPRAFLRFWRSQRLHFRPKTITCFGRFLLPSPPCAKSNIPGALRKCIAFHRKPHPACPPIAISTASYSFRSSAVFHLNVRLSFTP